MNKPLAVGWCPYQRAFKQIYLYIPEKVNLKGNLSFIVHYYVDKDVKHTCACSLISETSEIIIRIYLSVNGNAKSSKGFISGKVK